MNLEANMQQYKAAACTIAGIPARFWPFINVRSIENTANNTLVLLHYNDEFKRFEKLREFDETLRLFSERPLNDPELYLLDQCRGIIVDITGQRVLVRTHGFNYQKRLNLPLEYDNNGVMLIHQQSNIEGVIHAEYVPLNYNGQTYVTLHPGYDGPYISVFKADGTIFVATHRQIDGSNSRRGSDMTFFEMYNEIINGNEGGPSLNDMFDPKVLFSAYVHQFLIVHQKMRASTSTRGSQVIHLRTTEFDTLEHPSLSPDEKRIDIQYDPPFNWKEADGFKRKFTILPTLSMNHANAYMFPNQLASKIISNEVQGFEHNELVLEFENTQDVNDQSYHVTDVKIYQDETPRHSIEGGDYIIMYERDRTTGNVLRVSRLEPDTYANRSFITGDNPNPYNRFVTLVPNYISAKPDEKIRRIIVKQNDFFIKEYLPRIKRSGKGKDGNDILPGEVENLRRELLISLLEAAYAPEFKEDIRSFETNFVNDVERAAKFITVDYDKLVNNNADNKLGPQMNELILKTRGKIAEVRNNEERLAHSRYQASPRRSNTDHARYVLLHRVTGTELNRLINVAKRSRTSPEIARILDPIAAVPAVPIDMTNFNFPPLVDDTTAGPTEEELEEIAEELEAMETPTVISLWGQSTAEELPELDADLFVPDL